MQNVDVASTDTASRIAYGKPRMNLSAPSQKAAIRKRKKSTELRISNVCRLRFSTPYGAS